MLVDTTNTLSIRDIASSPAKYIFQPIGQNPLNLGFTRYSYWFKITTENNTRQTQNLLLSIAYPLLNEVTFYETNRYCILDSIVTGESYPFNTRRINNRNFVFMLSTNARDIKTFYIKIFNNGETVRIPFSLDKVDKLNEAESSNIFSSSIFFGYLLFGLILNILLLISFKEKIYIYFSVFVLAMTSFLFIGDGLAFQLLWPQSPWFENKSIIFSTLLANASLLLFTRDFFNYNKVNRFIYRFIYLIIGFYILVGILSFSSYPLYKYVVVLSNSTTFITAIFILLLSIYSAVKQFRASKVIFVGSFIILMSTTLLYILRNYGVLPHNFITQNGMKIGFALQIVFLTFAVVMRFKKVLTDTNQYLEEEVHQRTSEIEAQRDSLNEQKTYIENQNLQITDSIKYAQRIQAAVLPDNKLMTNLIGKHLLLFKPRDIVSGDFYWVAEKDGKTIVAVADCTGHGVPGGFLSMLGISFLNDIVIKEGISQPAEILNLLRLKVKTTLSNTASEFSMKDGMDISLCVIDRNNMIIEYAGAFNPIIHFDGKEIHEIAADRMPIGTHTREDVPFTNHLIKIKTLDKIYLFTDGIVDQFGGDQNKKFSKSSFKSLLATIQQLTIEEQKKRLEDALKQWKGKNDQVDDILVLGIII